MLFFTPLGRMTFRKITILFPQITQTSFNVFSCFLVHFCLILVMEVLMHLHFCRQYYSPEKLNFFCDRKCRLPKTLKENSCKTHKDTVYNGSLIFSKRIHVYHEVHESCHSVTGQFTPKMKANAKPHLFSSLVGIDCGVEVSQQN